MAVAESNFYLLILLAELQLLFIQSCVEVNGGWTLATQALLFGIERIVDGQSVLSFEAAYDGSAVACLRMTRDWSVLMNYANQALVNELGF